jgi:hypothetical protein
MSDKQYAIDSSGGFRVVDHAKRIGTFSFPTSPNAEAAKRTPAATARRILGEWWEGCPDKLREEHYALTLDDSLAWSDFE